jgi:indole-3-glycerol phosphate synthase
MSTKPNVKPLALSLETLKKVPGTLGRIICERFYDYEDYEGTTYDLAKERASFAQALRQPGLSIIAEVKRSSPSQGAIAPLEPVAAARAYAAGGAAAISVLTEPRHFDGQLSHLAEVARTISLPLLRKDFTIHPAQLDEAKAAGASAVLLIVAVLGEATASYLSYAESLGLDALVEVHDEAELEIALAAGSSLIGVNNRNLQTLEIDLATSPRLIRQAKAQGFEGILVAESGYKHAEELKPLQGLADAVLIGTSLASSGDLSKSLQHLLSGLAYQ